MTVGLDPRKSPRRSPNPCIQANSNRSPRYLSLDVSLDLERSSWGAATGQYVAWSRREANEGESARNGLELEHENHPEPTIGRWHIDLHAVWKDGAVVAVLGDAA